MEKLNEDEYLKQAHRILMKIMIEFDRVCRENNLKYYLICGGLIGAVRHKSFIPWDDDIDVAMTRDDFEKFEEIAKHTWQGEEFIYVSCKDMKHGAFLDYMNRLIYLKEEIPVNIYNKIEGKGRSDIYNHLALDIYTLDVAPNDIEAHKKNAKFIQGIYGLCMGHRAYIDYSEYSNTKKETKRAVHVLSRIGKVIPLKLLLYLYTKACTKYRNLESKFYFESNGWIFCIPLRFRQVWFAEGTEVEVDGYKFMAPKMYHEFLTAMYGDYMKLPPKEKRHPTHIASSAGIYHVAGQ